MFRFWVSAFVVILLLVLVLVVVLVLVLECVSNILVKNFRFSRTSTSTRTKSIRSDHMHKPYALNLIPYTFYRYVLPCALCPVPLV